MLIPHTAIPHTTDNELYIWCKFPQDAAFLQHNPRIFLYRRVYHAGYDRVLKNKYPNAPRKMWRNKEKLFSHPIDVFYTSSGKLIRSEFAFGNSDAIRWGNNYIFKLMVDGTTPFTARWFAGLFGYANDDAIRLNRCSRIYLNINGNNNKSIYVKIGFKLVTNVGESSMALCNVRATSWTENITGYEFMGTSFSV
jgi:hypothetical protein